MDKRDVAAEIEQKKLEVKAALENNDIAGAKAKKSELDDLQDKFNILDQMEKEELAAMGGKVVSGQVKPIAKKTENIAKAFVNAIRAGSKKEPVSKEDLEILNAGMKEGTNEDGGLTVPEDISTTIREMRRAEDALETLVNVEKVTKVKGSRVYEVNADTVPFDTVEEGGEFPEADTPKLKKVQYAIRKFGGILKTTYELLQDSTENILAFLKKWIAKKTKATRNALILKKLKEITDGKEIEIVDIDGLKDIFNVTLDPAIAAGAKVITNQSGFNWLDKLKDSDGNYILQKDPTQATKKLLFGEYPVVKLSNKTLKTPENGRIPVFCGKLEETITLFDRETMTIDISTVAADLWGKDQTGLKVRERLDCQAVDEEAIVKAVISTTPDPASAAIPASVEKYTNETLSDMTNDQIKKLAQEQGYKIIATTKPEMIAEFLEQQG